MLVMGGYDMGDVLPGVFSFDLGASASIGTLQLFSV
jgi:hypothetical protein